jgi:hypothetical protein
MKKRNTEDSGQSDSPWAVALHPIVLRSFEKITNATRKMLAVSVQSVVLPARFAAQKPSNIHIYETHVASNTHQIAI